jgi:hypothetical protein
MFKLDAVSVVVILGAVLCIFEGLRLWHELMPLHAHECCATSQASSQDPA